MRSEWPAKPGDGAVKSVMNKEDIVAEFKQFFEREFPMTGVELTETTNLLQDWFVDSLAIVNTTLFIESRFGISMARADINGDNFLNISTLADLVLRHLTS
ncbi:MAG: acyl carrier protein [Gammaproteobacteria bacterium]|jgi:acyl carrier protein